MSLSPKCLCLVWVLALAALAAECAAQEASPGARESSCRRAAQTFYDWYVPVTRKRLDRPASDVAIERRAAAFAPALLQALQADAKAQHEASGDIVGIDFDPFLNSQDPADRYDLRATRLEGDKCLVEVWADARHGSATRSRTPSAVAELSQQAGRWRFVNFRYPDMKTDLLAVLATLRKERGEPK